MSSPWTPDGPRRDQEALHVWVTERRPARRKVRRNGRGRTAIIRGRNSPAVADGELCCVNTVCLGLCILETGVIYLLSLSADAKSLVWRRVAATHILLLTCMFTSPTKQPPTVAAPSRLRLVWKKRLGRAWLSRVRRDLPAFTQDKSLL